MIQIKVFDDSDIEKSINKWLKENPNIEVVSLTSNPTHDNYPDGTICNQWVQTILIYKK